MFHWLPKWPDHYGLLNFIASLPKKEKTCPLKTAGWKTMFLLKWSLFRGHSLIFRGLLFCTQNYLFKIPPRLQVFAVKLPPQKKRSVWVRSVCVCFVSSDVFLTGGFKYFLCSPLLGVSWSNLTNIFQMGWNHQPVFHSNFRPPLFRFVALVEVAKVLLEFGANPNDADSTSSQAFQGMVSANFLVRKNCGGS